MSEPVRSDDAVARLARWSIARPGLIALLVGVAVLLGALAMRRIPVDAVPDITNVQVVVLTRAPGFGPIEIERLVTHPVEIGLAGIPGIREIRSISRTGISSVTVVFEDSVDALLARLQVSERLPSITEDLPPGTPTPEIGPFTTGLGEVYHFTVAWPGHSLVDTHTLVDWEIVHPLRRVPGVVEVNTWGGDVRQFQVRVDTNRMAARGVTLAMVYSALLHSNRSAGAGSIERDGLGVVVRGDGLLRDADEIGQVEVRREGALPVLVRDVADVQIGGALRTGAATADGRGEVVYVMVQMLAGANARTVVADIRRELEHLRTRLPPDIQIRPFYDRARFVGRVLNTVAHNLVEGAALVVLVLLLALGDLVAGLVVAALIPLAAVIGAAIVERLGLSGNLMSLGAIDFGLVVDGGVVMVEHALATAQEDREGTARTLASHSVSDVARPMAYGVGIIALVYVPILALEGVEGKMFRPMALVVLSVLASALALSLTLVPALSPWLVRRAQRRRSNRPPLLIRLAQRAYEPFLHVAVARPWVIVVALLAVVGVSGFVFTRLGGEFIPRLDEGMFAVQTTRPPSTSLDEAVRGTTVVERTLGAFPEVERVVSRSGSPAVATDLMGYEQSDVFVSLRDPSTWRVPYDRDRLAGEMDRALRRALPGTEFAFTQPIEMRMAELLSGIRSEVGVRVFGDDLDELRRVGDEVARVLRATPGGADVRVEQVDGLPTLSVVPDRLTLARDGMHSDDVLQFVQGLRAGIPVGRIFEGERRFDLVLRVSGAEHARASELRDLAMPIEGGGAIPLGSVAALDETFGPAQVSHERGERRIVIEANVRGRDLAGFVTAARQSIQDRVHLRRGYELEVGGQYQNFARAWRRLAIVLPIVLFMILVMLRASLGRWTRALLVFLNVPIAASGGILALAVRGLPLSITAGVGVIALAGIAVLNGLVLTTKIDDERAHGATPREAAERGARARLRPVLTTATVAALGFVPMALARGTGAEVQRPLATVIIGGLVTATAATLLLLPALASRARARV